MLEFDDVKVSEYKDAFAMFDKDRDGLINKKELDAMFRALGQTPNEQEISDMIREVDTQAKGAINFQEFLSMMARRRKDIDEQEDAVAAFNSFDLDKDGLISPNELKTVLARLGENLTDSEVADMIKESDKDGDGKLNLAEFLTMGRQ